MKKPNILLIMCDQLRFDVLGCYGNDYVKTPNIDRLAKRGVCFTNAYSQTPVCIPARHSLISGLNPFELGLCENANSRKEIRNPLPGVVRDNGYYTCAVGKMHFVPAREHFGFDKMYLSQEIAQHIEDDEYLRYLRGKGITDVYEPHGQRSENYYVPQISRLPKEHHTTAWTAKTTCEVIRKNKNRPFFIFSSFIKPHPPFDPCEPYDGMYDPRTVPPAIAGPDDCAPTDEMILVQNGYKVDGFDKIDPKKLNKIRAYYYACVSQVDDSVGMILDSLEREGLEDNTLVIFTSDHGEMLGDHRAFGKRTYYEQSSKIPFILRFPSVVPQGEYRDCPVILPDIYATLCDVTGGRIPAETRGISLMAAAKDRKAFVRDVLFAEYGEGRSFKCMMRWDRYKYIYHANGGKEQLFDLAADPNELDNIAKDQTELCEGCQTALYRYYTGYQYQTALSDGGLLRLEYEPLSVGGFLNQFPQWPSTVV